MLLPMAQAWGPRIAPFYDGSFDAVLLFAVLTCIPHDEDQRVLIDELVRVLKPGGILYISDLQLQDDQRNRERYDLFQHKYGVYGVFETGDGAICRYHTMKWLHSLVASCELLTTEEVEVRTRHLCERGQDEGKTMEAHIIVAMRRVPGETHWACEHLLCRGSILQKGENIIGRLLVAATHGQHVTKRNVLFACIVWVVVGKERQHALIQRREIALL